MQGEEESLSGQRLFKDYSWRIAEKGWVSGSENLDQINSTYITTFCLRGLRENEVKKIKCFHQKTISIIFSCQTWLELSNGTGFYGQM